MNFANKFLEFLSVGIFTPFAYVMYSAIVILFTFLLGLPIAIGIRVIQLTTNWLFNFIQ